MDEFNSVPVFERERAEILSVDVSTVYLYNDGWIVLLAEIEQFLYRQLRKVELLGKTVEDYVHFSAVVVVGAKIMVIF